MTKMMTQGRPFEFAVPEDMSINKPSTLVESHEIIGLYNQAHSPNNHAKKVSESVKTWFDSEAKTLGWETIDFVDSRAILGLTSLRYGND